MDDPVLYTVNGSRATITLNRPDMRNALNGALVRSLTAALKQADADPAVRVVVLTGAGSTFCAGADLESLQALQDASLEENLADSEALAVLFQHIYQLGKPVIARINGHAIAGGSGLAAVCDFSIAVEEARLGFTEVRIGFVPAIVSFFVLRKIGETAARDLLLSGRLISAGEAAQIGLITRNVPADKLDQAVDELAEGLATQTSATAQAIIKRLLADLPGMSLEEAMAHAAQVNAQARSTENCKAGIAAFLNKTDPPWRRLL